MRYSIEPRDRMSVKDYGFLSFAKNMSLKYNQKLLDSAKNSRTDPIKSTSKKAIQKTAEATGDLIGNKIADKITNASTKSSKELHSEKGEANNEIPKKRYISPKKTANY